MKRELIIALFLIFVPIFSFSLWGREKGAKSGSVPILERIIENQSTYSVFFSLPYDNPTMRFKMYDYTLNEVAVKGEFRKESQPILMQIGDGYRYGSIDVNSFINKGNSSMWGKASYRNGTQENMKWNETSDYLLLYPYVVGDSLGGDFKSERYFFNGGYTAKKGRFIWGADASYCATLGYRQIDPRPRNITGKLDFTLGLALTGIHRYRIGISVNASKYKQKNDIKFYNEQGNVTLYHFTGMGMDYYRFRGEKNETYYKGNQFGGSVNLLPEKNNGFTANVSFNNFRFEKIISSLNELPMARVTEYTWKGELGYKQKQGGRSWGVKVGTENVHRKGIENLFGNPANNIYPLIASAQQYSNKRMGYTLSGFYESALPNGFSWAVYPGMSYHRMLTRYIYPARELENDRFNSAISVQIRKRIDKILLRAQGAVCYSAALSARLQLPDDAEEPSLESLRNYYRILSSDYTLLQFGLRGDFAIKQRLSLYFFAQWQHGRYAKISDSDEILAAIGVAF